MIPLGLCQCGCGEKTARATRTDRNAGHYKGEYKRYLPGHNMRSPNPEYVVDEDTGCWIWQRTKNWGGYGTFPNQVKDSTGSRLAHRVIYERHKGPIPERLHIDHLCRVPACVNPDHLEPVTCAENHRRGVGNAGKTHCVNGHEFTPENTHITTRGARKCRACDRDRHSAKYAAEKVLAGR